VTSDGLANAFPRLSPDGEKLAFLSWDKSVKGYPAREWVMLRMLSLKDGKITVLARFTGGQGSLDAACWSPDSRRLVFVSYQDVPQDAGDQLGWRAGGAGILTDSDAVAGRPATGPVGAVVVLFPSFVTCTHWAWTSETWTSNVLGAGGL
jgi:hypothetical protein